MLTTPNPIYSYIKDETVIYSDLSFKPEQYGLAINLEAVMNSLVNLISTVPGERLNRPNFGVDIESLLFEPMDYITAQAIFTKIADALDTWEPRVRLDLRTSNVIPRYEDNAYEVQLYFYIIGLNIEFKLKRFYRYKGASSQE